MCFDFLTWSHCGFMRWSRPLSSFVSTLSCFVVNIHIYNFLWHWAAGIQVHPYWLTAKPIWALTPEPSQSPRSHLLPAAVTGRLAFLPFFMPNPKFSHCPILFSPLLTTVFSLLSFLTICVANCSEGWIYKTFTGKRINSVKSQKSNKKPSSLQFQKCFQSLHFLTSPRKH